MLDTAMDTGIETDPRPEEAMEAEQEALVDDEDHVSKLCFHCLSGSHATSYLCCMFPLDSVN